MRAFHVLYGGNKHPWLWSQIAKTSNLIHSGRLKIENPEDVQCFSEKILASAAPFDLGPRLVDLEHTRRRSLIARGTLTFVSLVKLEQAKPLALHSAAKHAKQAGQQKNHNMTWHAREHMGCIHTFPACSLIFWHYCSEVQLGLDKVYGWSPRSKPPN